MNFWWMLAEFWMLGMMENIDMELVFRDAPLTAIYQASPIVSCWLGDLKPWSVFTDSTHEKAIEDT